MKHILTALSFCALASPALACEAVSVGSLEVTEAWSRASIGTARPGVVYLTVTNSGETDDALMAISTPVADMPMLHQTVMNDGVASMPHAMQVPVQAGEQVALEPGGYHAMLMDLTQALKEGDTFPVTLTFRDAGEVTVTVSVENIAASGPTCAAPHE